MERKPTKKFDIATICNELKNRFNLSFREWRPGVWHALTHRYKLNGILVCDDCVCWSNSKLIDNTYEHWYSPDDYSEQEIISILSLKMAALHPRKYKKWGLPF